MAVNLRRRLAASLILFGCALAPADAAAQAGPPTSTTTTPTKEAKEEAQRRFEQGKDLYEESDYRGALIEFRRAYQLAPHFKLLYTIAQVYYQLQDYASSLLTFEKYLAEGGREVPAARKAEVEREIERLKTRVAKVDITSNYPGAEITVDDVDMGTTPLSKPLLLSAGRRKITVSLKGKAPVTRIVDLAGGDSTRLAFELLEEDNKTAKPAGPSAADTKSSEATPKDSDKHSSGAKFPWVAWGITGALGIGTAVTGVLALKASSDLASKRDTPNVGSEGLQDARSKTTTLALCTDILGAATVVVGGVALYLTFKKTESPVQVGVGPGAVQVSGRF